MCAEPPPQQALSALRERAGRAEEDVEDTLLALAETVEKMAVVLHGGNGPESHQLALQRGRTVVRDSREGDRLRLLNGSASLFKQPP